VVARPVGDLSSLVREGQTGRIVSGMDAGDLADAIELVISDTTLRRTARIEGPDMVRERFSVQNAVDVLAPLYRRLAKKAGR